MPRSLKIALLFTLFFGHVCLAQKENVDSLLNLLATSTDSVKASILIKVSQYYQSRETEKSLKFCQDAIILSEKLKNKSLIGNAYYRLGNIYNGTGDYTEAFKALLKAFNIYDEIKYYKGMANASNSISNMYMALKDSVSTLKYLKIGLENAKKSGDEGALGVINVGLGNLYNSQKNFGTAISYFQDAANIFKKMQGKEMEYSICMVNIGSAYLGMNSFQKADAIYQDIIPLVDKIGNKYVLALTNAQSGLAKAGLKDHKAALAYFYKGLATANEIKAKDNIAEISGYLATTYSSLGKNDSAYKYEKMFAELRETIFNETSAQQTAEMDKKYESAKKDKEIVQQNAAIEKGNLDKAKSDAQRNTFIIGFALMCVLAIFVYRGYYQKKKDAIEISKQKAIIEEKNKDITDSMRYAQNIQGAILPPDDLMYEHLKEFFVLYKPKDIVSGDFYWMHLTNDGVLIGSIDCTGHGVPGALMSIVGHNALKQVVSTSNKLTPASILNHLHIYMREMFTNKYSTTNINDGMDAALCLIDRKGMKIKFAGAHNPLYHISDLKLKETRGSKQSISGQEEGIPKPFLEHDAEIKKGDCLYIFSDGYTDQFGGPEGKKFKSSQFKELLLSIHAKPMHEQKNILDSTIEKWKGDHEQIDDILVIGVRI